MRKHLITVAITTGLFLSLTGIATAGWDEGVAAFKAGKWDEAIRQLQPVVNEREKAGQKWAGGHFVLGQALLKANRNSEAVAQLDKAYRLDGNNVGIQLRLGEAYAAQQIANIDWGVPEDDVRSMTVPALVYSGANDDYPLPDNHALAKHSASLAPNATFLPLPGFDHGQGFQESATVVPHVREFLAKVEAAAPI